jgi:signal transduction histidine kinase
LTSPPLPDDAVAAIAREVSRIGEEKVRLLDRLADGERRFRSISRGVLRMQEAERGRISRELHDGVGQSLTALKVQLELMERSAEASASAFAERLAELRELADQTLQEVREISHLLRPQMLDELGLVPTLRWLARTFQKRTGIVVTLTCEGVDDDVPPEVETVLFRIAQESLTNVARHAGSPNAEVVLRRAAERLVLTVQDHGAGFDVEAAQELSERDDDRGFGLRGMRDRVQLFRGRLSVTSLRGQGTTIEADVPLDVETEGRKE